VCNRGGAAVVAAAAAVAVAAAVAAAMAAVPSGSSRPIGVRRGMGWWPATVQKGPVECPSTPLSLNQ